MKLTAYFFEAMLVLGGLGGCSNDSATQASNGSGGRATFLGTGGQRGVDNDANTGGALSQRLGDVLEFIPGTGDVPYAIADNAYGIRGGGFLARSVKGNTITIGNDAGKICIQGNLDEVPSGNYGQYWGVEIGFNLNQGLPVTTQDAGAASDASSDAASDASADATASDAAEVARDWIPGEVIGFSFVIEGPTINIIRVKALPAGYDATLESSVFCKQINAKSGDVQESLFTEMRQYCWDSPPTLLIPTSAGLANISWQLPADVGVGARPFDWCLRDLRPILTPPVN
jgi:hypothetical protein